MNKKTLDLDKSQYVSPYELYCLTGLTKRFWEERRHLKNGPPYVKISKRCIRYKWDDVIEWLESKKVIELKQSEGK